MSAADVPRGFLWRWVVASDGGAVAGYAVPAVMLTLTLKLLGDAPDNRSWLRYEMDTFAVVHARFALAGAIFGWAQWRALRVLLPRLPKPAWIAISSVSAVVLLIPSILALLAVDSATGGVDLSSRIAAGMTGGVMAGAIGGALQAAVLRQYIATGGFGCQQTPLVGRQVPRCMAERSPFGLRCATA